MNQLKHILIAWDFSPGAEAALDQALRLAKWNQSRLTVLHVIHEQVMEELALALNQPRAKVEATARQAAQTEMEARLAREDVAVSARVVVGSPLHELLTAVLTMSADLLVAGARNNSEPGTSTGTLAAKLMRKAATKVMLVQPGQNRPYRRIVACVDFSETSAEAVKQALRVSLHDDSQVHCLHVYEPPWHDLQHRMPSLVMEPGFQSHFEAAMRARLHEFVGSVGGNPKLAALYGAEHHSHGIAEFAHQTKADLIVLGTHGRSHVQYMLLGSTAEGLLRDLQCSVLTIRAKDAPNIFDLANNKWPRGGLNE
jgi:nucleotide-binding universal stress UspA family protein